MTTLIVSENVANKLVQDKGLLTALRQADPQKEWRHVGYVLALNPPAAGSDYEQQYHAYLAKLQAIEGLRIRRDEPGTPTNKEKHHHSTVEVEGTAHALLQALALPETARAYRRLVIPTQIMAKTSSGNLGITLSRVSPDDTMGGARYELTAAADTDLPDYYAQLQGIKGLKVLRSEENRVLVEGSARALVEAIAMGQTATCCGAPFMRTSINEAGYAGQVVASKAHKDSAVARG